MTKSKKITWIFSCIMALVLLCASLFTPFLNKTEPYVSVGETNNTLYAFVSKQTNTSTTGKVYVDFGISLDVAEDEEITREDALMMSNANIHPFDSAKIYIRTRNVSAIAEAGDYEAMDQVYTVYGNSPFTSISINVNKSGLQIGNTQRTFYVEIYKVEFIGLKEGYEYVEPFETPQYSRETLETNSEYRVGQTTKTYAAYSLDHLNLGQYEYVIPQTECKDVTTNTSFNDVVIDMANISYGWYDTMKYLSDHDMVKLGLRLVVSAYENPNGAYTDNSYVGVQIFGGNSKLVGAPALEGVPEKNIYTHSQVQELARWFAKFQSDEREDLELENAFNGKFEGVTVGTMLNENVYIPHALARKDYGQGGAYDAFVDDVSNGTIVIDNLGEALKETSTISIRFWKYLSSKQKHYNGWVYVLPTNYRATVESATFGQLYKDENGKEKIGVSLRFNEPLQFKRYTDGTVVAPHITGHLNGISDNAVDFQYVAGEGTDTLFFEADVSNHRMNATRINLESAYGFQDVFDYAPLSYIGGVFNYQYLSVMNGNTINAWDDVADRTYFCSYDLRTPEIDMNGSATQTVKKSHTVTIRKANISEKGKIYYAWTNDDTTVPTNLTEMAVVSQEFQTIASPANVSGVRYLYAIAVSEIGKQSAPMWAGPFNFDNEKPILSVLCTKNTYVEKKFDITITNNEISGFTRFADLKTKMKAIVSSDANGKDVIKEIPITIPGDYIDAEQATITGFTLSASDIGLQLGGEVEFGTYYVSFTAGDVLENNGTSTPIPYYFDVREIFECSLVKNAGDPDFEMTEFAMGGAGSLALEENYYTIDLSKKDVAAQNGKSFYFTMAIGDENVESVSVEKFENVTTENSIIPYITESSSDGKIIITIANKFEPGLYRLILKEKTDESKKKSLPIYFYVTEGKDSKNSHYQENTGAYQSVSLNSAFTNKGYQIPTSVPFYYLTDTGAIKTQSYSNTNRPATFSSWSSALSYIYYREQLDLYAVTLTQSFADSLNSNIYRRADMNRVAHEGEIWIRYKEVNWRPGSTINSWVYYYYGEDSSSLPINTEILGGSLQNALDTVSAMICSSGVEVNMVTEEYLDKNGAPYLHPDQMHLNAESSKASMCGTVFAKEVQYFGDPGMFITLNEEAPLSTNATVKGGEYRRIYYKTEGNEYRLLTLDNRETFGEYFNATGRFTILELDENGAREYGIYVDKTAPVLTISWKTQSGTQTKDFSKDDSGQTISGNNFFVEGMLDYDTLSFVAIYKYTGQGEGELLQVYRKVDFDNGQGIRLEDGKYHVHVSDRSGNDYAFILQVKAEPLICSLKEVANTYIRMDVNRSEAEVRYQVYRDGRLLTTDFSENKFTEGGEYRFLIEDIYGNVYDETFVFVRDMPVVTWQYQTAEGHYALYEEDCERLVINEIDDQNYLLSTSTYLRFLPLDGCVYEIISGGQVPSVNPTTGWVSFNSISTFTMRVYYEEDPETYVLYTCTVDNTAPVINVLYQNSYYQPFEMEEIAQKLANGDFEIGENEFTPSLIGFEAINNNASTVYVLNGEQVQSKYFQVQVSDENGVKLVEVYLDGELILTKESNFSNIYLSRRGSYQIVATDIYGNKSSFVFSNEYEERVFYFVDDEAITSNTAYEDNFLGQTYMKVDYGNTQAEIQLHSSAEVHYLITDAKGGKHYFAFVVEDEKLYTLQYVVFVEDGEYGLEIESLTARGVMELKTGIVAEIPSIGVAIYYTRTSNGVITLEVRSTDKNEKTYTVETRVSLSENESPYYFKTEISTIPSVIEFMDENGNMISALDTIKVNESFIVKDTISEEIESVEVAFSLTDTYTTYETIYDGGYRRVVFKDEGMYHVRVVNRYGVETSYYVILSPNMAVTTTVRYEDGTTLTYSTKYEETEFYSNKSVEFTVYATNIQVVDKPNGVTVQEIDARYTTIFVNGVGDYHLVIKDEYGNTKEVDVFIHLETLTLDQNILTNFNDAALRRDENYTNKQLYINEAAFEDKIAFISMTYNDKTITVFDGVSEEQIAFDETTCVGALGDGAYTLVFRDYYGNKAETVVHYSGTPTLTILRRTLNSVGVEEYSLEEAETIGVWTNDSVRFSISATEYDLTVDGMKNVFSIDYSSKSKNEYQVRYVDEYGFTYNFKVYLYRANVVITPSANMSVSKIFDLFVTKESVQIDFTDDALCTYTLNNEAEKSYQKGDVLYKDGVYRFKVIDKAGNIATYVIKKDSAVEYHLEGTGANDVLINGAVTNGNSVKFVADNLDSAYIKKVFHNNKFIEYESQEFTERGKWEIIVADEVGNESYFRFYIIYGKLDGFTYNTPYNYEITSVKWELENTVDDAKETTVKNSGTLLEATENGTYTVTMKSLTTGDEKTFTFTIDKTPPQVELVGCEQNEKTINNVTLKGCKVGDVVYVYRDGELVKTVRIESDYMDPPTISESGKYRIVVENEAGIQTELVFERKYIPNVAGSILIIVLGLAMVTGLMVGLIWRNHSKTDD